MSERAGPTADTLLQPSAHCDSCDHHAVYGEGFHRKCLVRLHAGIMLVIPVP